MTTPDQATDETIMGYTATGEPMILKHHSAKACVPPCAFHAPSDHPLKDAPLNWRSGLSPFDGRRLLERLCEHGVGHPDPDGLAFANQNLPKGQEPDTGVHGCCLSRCCSGSSFDPPAEQPENEAANAPTGPIMLGIRELVPEDLKTMTGTHTHKILYYDLINGFEIRNDHSDTDCDDNLVYVHYFARALFSPPPQAHNAERVALAYFTASHEIPLVSTCELGEELITDMYCWEPAHLHRGGDYLNDRGLTRLAMILNDYTAELRNGR